MEAVKYRSAGAEGRVELVMCLAFVTPSRKARAVSIPRRGWRVCSKYPAVRGERLGEGGMQWAGDDEPWWLITECVYRRRGEMQ